MKTRALTEASIITAIAVVIIFLNTYFPMFYLIGNFVLPIPFAILYVRWNYKYSLMSIIAASLITMFLMNPIAGLLNGIVTGSIGFIMGYSIAHKFSYKKTIVLITVTSIISLVISNYIAIAVIDKDTVSNSINKLVTTTKKTYEEVSKTSNLPKEQAKELNKRIDLILSTDFIIKMLPMVFLGAGIISAFLTYKIAEIILGRLKMYVPRSAPFSEFYLDNIFGLGILIFLLTGLVLNYLKVQGGSFILSSIIMITAMALALEGLAVVAFYLRRKFKMSKVVAGILIIIILFSPLMSIYIYLGLADMLLDFRKIHRKRLVK